MAWDLPNQACCIPIGADYSIRLVLDEVSIDAELLLQRCGDGAVYARATLPVPSMTISEGNPTPVESPWHKRIACSALGCTTCGCRTVPFRGSCGRRSASSGEDILCIKPRCRLCIRIADEGLAPSPSSIISSIELRTSPASAFAAHTSPQPQSQRRGRLACRIRHCHL